MSILVIIVYKRETSSIKAHILIDHNNNILNESDKNWHCLMLTQKTKIKVS